MSLLVNDGGANALLDFGRQVDGVAEGRVRTSMDTTESKWQLIAELVRLLIELWVFAVLAAISVDLGRRLVWTIP